MDKQGTGLVIGKFYPPHRGHKFLIDTAFAQVDKLVVLVCDNPTLSIDANLRADWLREIHPQVDVRVIPDIGQDDDSQAWADYTRLLLGDAPDVVFTSEGYGEEYARCLGCRHVSVDRARTHIPVSGTAVRNDPFAQWKFLEPCVRAYFTRRIAVFGAESSGSTTLARDLAAYYHTVWVPEYGRDYAADKIMREGQDAVWHTEEFTHIAQQQCEWEEVAARQADKILICDTPAFATSVWHERYLGQLSSTVEDIARPHHYDLYLLTDVDIPFVQDGTRDGEHIRHAMHKKIVDWLTARGLPFTILSGTHEARMNTAICLVDALLTQKEK